MSPTKFIAVICLGRLDGEWHNTQPKMQHDVALNPFIGLGPLNCELTCFMDVIDYSCFTQASEASPKTCRPRRPLPANTAETLPMLEAAAAVNIDQKHPLIKKVLAKYCRNLNVKTFALWGLAFKLNTNEMRDTLCRVLVQALLRSGAHIVTRDPLAHQEEAHRVLALDLAETPALMQYLRFANKRMQAVQCAAALIIVSVWKAYRRPVWEALKVPVIFFDCNFYEPHAIGNSGNEYGAIDRSKHILLRKFAVIAN